MRGKVKNWFDDRGFGFIIAEDGKEIFAHFSGIIGDSNYKKLIKGQEVEFDLQDDPRGQKAVNIKEIERTSEKVE